MKIAEPSLSYRKIAKRLGISHQTVNRLLKGYSPGEKRESRQLQQDGGEVGSFSQERLPRPVNPNSRDCANHGTRRIEYERCAGCGGMIQAAIPCLACSVKAEISPSFDCYLNELMVPASTFPISNL